MSKHTQPVKLNEEMPAPGKYVAQHRPKNRYHGIERDDTCNQSGNRDNNTQKMECRVPGCGGAFGLQSQSMTLGRFMTLGRLMTRGGAEVRRFGAKPSGPIMCFDAAARPAW